MRNENVPSWRRLIRRRLIRAAQRSRRQRRRLLGGFVGCFVRLEQETVPPLPLPPLPLPPFPLPVHVVPLPFRRSRSEPTLYSAGAHHRSISGLGGNHQQQELGKMYRLHGSRSATASKFGSIAEKSEVSPVHSTECSMSLEPS
jgi:hypothetical protein